MLNQLFNGLFNTGDTAIITFSQFFICMVTAILLGILTAKVYTHKTKCTKGFVMTLALLPVVVAMVIIMVNGNIGAGVAVAGAFSLVRFRSVPGTAKEIGAVFTAMGTGLAVGMGYVGYAVLFSIIACVFSYLLNATNFGEQKNNNRSLHITIPENLNYTDVFDDLFATYTNSANLMASKTTGMGSLFKLSYEVDLKDPSREKEFIDEIRTRNGNLEIVLTTRELFANSL